MDAIAPEEEVRRVVLCCGKVYYDLVQERRDKGVRDVDIIRVDVPDTIDLTTGKITCRQKKVHRFIIKFRGSELRRG